MGKQIIIIACVGTFNPDLITAKLVPVIAEAGLQIEGASTAYGGQQHLAIGRPEDLNAALDVLNVSRVLAPEKKEGAAPPSPASASTGKAGKVAKAGKKEDGLPTGGQPPVMPTTQEVEQPSTGTTGSEGPIGEPGPDGGNNPLQTEPLPPPCSE